MDSLTMGEVYRLDTDKRIEVDLVECDFHILCDLLASDDNTFLRSRKESRRANSEGLLIPL